MMQLSGQHLQAVDSNRSRSDVPTLMHFDLEELQPKLFTDLGAPGVRGTSALFEAAVAGLHHAIDAIAPSGAERHRFPPVMSRRHIEAAGYDRSFPNLLGVVSARADANAPYAATDLVLTPASCYPVYPHVASEGPTAAAGRIFDVCCDCFRCEPSRSPVRLQSFRMREFVFIGAPKDASAFRDARQAEGLALFSSLRLSPEPAPANDPFFGPGAAFLKARQRAGGLKYELLVEIIKGGEPTACGSFNYHHGHFADVFDLRMAGGERAHSACAAFGLDRLAAALFARHGENPGRWPADVRAVLGM